MVKSVIIWCIFFSGVFAAQTQWKQSSKHNGETNSTVSSVQNKPVFKTPAKPQPGEMKFKSNYYPRGTIATH